MNDRERFKAICRGDTPDYVPIFGLPGAPGVSFGCMQPIHRRLVEQGMPPAVGGFHDNRYRWHGKESWYRYWGTTGPIELDFFPAQPGRGLRRTTRVEGQWEIVESETGARPRQVLDNAVTYSLPHYEVYDVRDRQSWEFYRERMTPGARWDRERIDQACRKFDDRTQPRCVPVGGYLPNIDHTIQPMATFESLCRFMTLLHEACGNLEGEFPRTA